MGEGLFSKDYTDVSLCLKSLIPAVTRGNDQLFRQNTYLQNKKHTLTCQGGDWLLQI